ncbi:MAG: M48 family metalloprotease [Candidatus Bathyarchaeota archaeon]|nr:M48 family metalloprotease [Candidatus Bathyarchaeota archaeon]
MVNLTDFLIQIFQPYFFYSLVFLSIAFVCIKIFLKFNPYLSRKNQSILWLIPLFVPVFTLLYFHPQILIPAGAFSPSNYQIPVPPGFGIMFVGPSVFSFTGLLCISGIIAAGGFLVLMAVFGKKIAMRRFHVVMMAEDEYMPLQEKVKETAHKLGIPEPKVGLIDDLMPNAFTVGYGQNTIVVFSLGLLKMLDPEELEAVVSHELAHVKANDYLFRTVSYTLNILSFFNPLSYFVAAHAQRQRELLADEKGVALLDKPKLMTNVLTKIESVALAFPKASLTERLSAGLFLVSPLAHRHGILASHPQISQRVQNINAVTSKPIKKSRHLIATVLLLSVLVSTAVIAGYSTVQIQKTFSQNEDILFANGNGVRIFNASADYSSTMHKGILFTDAQRLHSFVSSLQCANSAGDTVLTPNGTITLQVINEQQPQNLSFNSILSFIKSK